MWRVLGSCFSKREREERESSKEMCGEYLEAASLRERERRERSKGKAMQSRHRTCSSDGLHS